MDTHEDDGSSKIQKQQQSEWALGQRAPTGPKQVLLLPSSTKHDNLGESYYP